MHRGVHSAARQTEDAPPAKRVHRESPGGQSTSAWGEERVTTTSPSLEVVGQRQTVASPSPRPVGGLTDITYLGWDPDRVAGYNVDDYPMRSDIVHQYMCSRSPTSLQEIPDDFVRRAAEAVPRSWTKTLDKIVSEQDPIDNVRLAVIQASLSLVALHRVIEQVDEQTKQLSDKEEELSALREEALKAKHIADAKDKALAAAEDRAKRAEEIAWSSMAGEKDALTKLEQDRAELFHAKTTLTKMEEEKSAAEEQLKKVREALEAANTEITQLLSQGSVRRVTKQVDVLVTKEKWEAVDFGYICAHADCMRMIKYAKGEGEDVFEAVKNEFIKFVQKYPPVAGYPLPVGDLSEWGIDLSIFGPDVEILNPVQASSDEATLNEEQEVT